MIAGVAPKAYFGYPSYIYNQPQYYAPSYPSLDYAYGGVAGSQGFQQRVSIHTMFKYQTPFFELE